MAEAIKIRKGESGRVTVTFPFNPTYVAKIKTVEGRRWHPEGKYWSFPPDNAVVKRIASLFEGEKLDIDPSLQTRDFEDLRRELVSRKYSQKTIKAYLHYNENFLKSVKKNPAEVTNEDIKKYLFYLAETKNYSASTINTAINALGFYYGGTLKRDFVYAIKRPKKDKKLPVVLSQEEVSKILSAVYNIKHRAILMLVYSAGLRVSEVAKLKVEDIDTQRKLIHIRGAKGRKDRYTILSDITATVLREYWKEYNPDVWLFSGSKHGEHIGTRTVEKVFTNAC